MLLKLPLLSFNKIERVLKSASTVKDLFTPAHTEPESELYKQLKKQEDAIYVKKNEISKLREENEDLKEKLENYRSILDEYNTAIGPQETL